MAIFNFFSLDASNIIKKSKKNTNADLGKLCRKFFLVKVSCICDFLQNPQDTYSFKKKIEFQPALVDKYCLSENSTCLIPRFGSLCIVTVQMFKKDETICICFEWFISMGLETSF